MFLMVKKGLIINPEDISSLNILTNAVPATASKLTLATGEFAFLSMDETTDLLVALPFQENTMSTLNKEICEDIIKGNGTYRDDAHTGYTKIVTYNNMFDGGLAFAAVTLRDNQNKYEESEACKNVQTYWTRENGRNENWKET